MDELQKALNDKNLSVLTLPGKGRCLFTTRDLSPGEVIFSEGPYVSVAVNNEESPEPKCEWCFSSSNLKKCSACYVVWYCSSQCQKSDWKMHREECQAMKKVDKVVLKSLTPPVRLCMRLCIRRKLHNQKIIPTTATDNYKLIEDLSSHISELNENLLVVHTQIAKLVKSVLQWPDSEINIKQIAENSSKLACNAYTICNSELRSRGTGLYPVISFINHSCLPNSVVVFEERLAVVRAVQHIPKHTEIKKDSYANNVEFSGTTKKYLTSLMNWNVFQRRLPCYFPPAVIEELQLKLYCPLSINLMRTRETRLKILMKLQDMKEALSYTRLIIPTYERVYPKWHPGIGLQYYMSGKLEWLLEKTDASVRSLKKALDIVCITHGTKSTFILGLMSELDEARKEASYLRRTHNRKKI